MTDTQTNLKNLESLLAVLSTDHLTKEDFVKEFEKVINFVLRIEKQNTEAITRLEETYQMLLEKLHLEHSNNFKSLKSNVNELFVGDKLKEMDIGMKGKMSEYQKIVNQIIDKKLKEVDVRMSKVKDGERGLMGPPGITGSDKPEDIAQKLNSLTGAVDRKVIKGIDELIRRIASSGRKMGMKKIAYVRSVDLSGSVNGSTTAFTLPQDTLKVLGVWSTQFPITFRDGTDWTFAGRTLTLVTSQLGTPQSGQTLWALVETAFYANSA